MKFLLVLLATLALSVSASNVVLFTRHAAPRDWTVTNPTSGHETVEFMVALKQRNLDVLERIAREVSDPDHDEYQNFKTREEIMSIVAPEPATVHTVKHWLTSHGAKHIKDFGDALEVRTTVDIASKLFSTSFQVFTHEDGRRLIRQWGPYSVPAHIYKHIDFIEGLSNFPVPHYKFQTARSPADFDQGVIAQSLWTIYQVPPQSAGNATGTTSQGVIEFQGQNFAPDDLKMYSQLFGVPVQSVSTAHTIGPNDPTNAQTEAELDIQMIATVNTEADNWFWLEQGQGWLYQFVVHFFDTIPNVPNVISISYGWWEGDQCSIAPTECSQLQVNSQAYVDRVNAEFQKIAIANISILSATGDSGANGRTNEDCSIPQLRAAFPGSSPWLTAVGATQLNNVTKLPNPPAACQNNNFTCVNGGQEVAVSYDVSSFASGGGFSNFTAQEKWQAAAVTAYLNSGVALPPDSYFNRSGRAFPDVAAIGHNTLIYQGAVQAVGGTSASTPIFAAIVALLNQVAIKHSGKPLGFLNQLLYQAYADDPTNFNDITVGDNKCTEQGCSASCDGFLATKGWDPVTGLGSPNYPKLAAYVVKVLQRNEAKRNKRHHHHHGKH